MGDRGNIVNTYDAEKEERVVFYAHWSGSLLAKVVQGTLKKRERWKDSSYLARMIFCELVKGQEMDCTGFGISTRLCDNQHILIHIDHHNQKVNLVKEANFQRLTSEVSYTFEEFILLEEKSLQGIAEM